MDVTQIFSVLFQKIFLRGSCLAFRQEEFEVIESDCNVEEFDTDEKMHFNFNIEGSESRMVRSC